MSPLSKVFTLGALTLFISACQTQPTEVVRQSDVLIPATFSQDQAAQGSQDISRWWEQWNDPVLTSLIEQGLQSGFDIRVAQSRLAEASAISRLAKADLGPQAGVNASTGISKSSAELSSTDRLGLPGGAIAPLEDRFRTSGDYGSVGFAAAWEPDIFGQKQSDADAAAYAQMGVQEQVYGAQMLVASQIADHYLQARAAKKREAIIDSTIATLTEFERYVQLRFNAGDATINEVNNTKSKLNAARAQKSTLNAEYAANVRSIAVLIGQTPQNFTLPKAPKDIFTGLPAAPTGQTPQGLLERRPDIRANAALVNAYSARLASAEADLLPRFSINFLGQGGRIDIDSDVPKLSGWGSILNVGVQLPLFTNGRIQANIDNADARLQTALLEYDQTLLRALGEVDSAYQFHHALQEQQSLLVTAYRQSEQHASDARKLFRYGYHTLDYALRAEIESQELRENLLKSRLAQAQMLINLNKALGGGWS
ncbi:TolC family protein [Psychrobacter jeotgali]|uniref:TolC family protein n=1 Tax=Psychrobacter jeotgali TaxID=179010 RepID=UPI001917FAB6|nr:TolC family protein [Psychrobacter jeotgali]